jgi:hypothetical protein
VLVNWTGCSPPAPHPQELPGLKAPRGAFLLDPVAQGPAGSVLEAVMLNVPAGRGALSRALAALSCG